MSKTKILIVCKGNTCRSIMFQSVLSTKIDSSKYEILSAGSTVDNIFTSLNFTNQQLKRKQLPIFKDITNSITDYEAENIDLLIILDDSISEDIIDSKKVMKYSVSDPYRIKNVNKPEAIPFYNSTFSEIEDIIDSKTFIEFLGLNK